MKRLIFIFIIGFIATVVLAQTTEADQPRRTPQEIAQKQTERLQRDLQLTEQQRDTVYRIYLKYAYLRRPNEERQVVEERISKMREELQMVMTDEQRATYFTLMREFGPRRQSTPRMKVAQAAEN